MSPSEADARPPTIEGGHIAGVVRDNEGEPLVGVRVEAAVSGGADLDLLPTLTDGQGRFDLEGLAPGRYDLRFELGKVRSRTLEVPTGTLDLTVTLARPQGLLLVVRTERGAPLPALIHVVLDREATPRPLREHIGRSLTSRLLLSSLRPGTYTLTVWGGPYLPVVVRGLEVAEGRAAAKVEVVLSAHGGAVEGLVVSAAGVGVEALLAWRRLDQPSPWPRAAATLTSDPEGRFVIRGLPGGRYRVSAHRPGAGFCDVELEVQEGQSSSLRMPLATGLPPTSRA